MNYNNFETYFSQARTNRYYLACALNPKKAQKLYLHNQKLAQAFHPLLITTEIWVRNAISEAMRIHFSDRNWIINQRIGFMTKLSNNYILNEVNKAENKLRRLRIAVTSDKIIAEQTFGFWVTLLDSNHAPFIGGCTLHAFPHRSTTIQRHGLHTILKEVSGFRNRINHGEPICFTGNRIDTSKATNVFDHLKNISFWINPVLQPYLLRLENGMITRQIATINAI